MATTDQTSKTQLFMTPYATDISDSFTPKSKFLFAVAFYINEPFQQYFGGVKSIGSLVYKFERPQIEIEHEDVNLYNFKTQVPKQVKYNPVSMSVHDDKGSNSMGTLVHYVRSLSPIFNISGSAGTTPNYENVSSGLDFSIGSAPSDSNFSSASFGTLQQSPFSGFFLNENGSPIENMTSIFSKIQVFHLFDANQYMDVYSFFNPKITNIAFDELNMTESATNSITFEFVYDGMYIEPHKSTTDSSELTALSEICPGMVYNLGFPVQDLSTNNSAGNNTSSTQQAVTSSTLLNNSTSLNTFVSNNVAETKKMSDAVISSTQAGVGLSGIGSSTNNTTIMAAAVSKTMNSQTLPVQAGVGLSGIGSSTNNTTSMAAVVSKTMNSQTSSANLSKIASTMSITSIVKTATSNNKSYSPIHNINVNSLLQPTNIENVIKNTAVKIVNSEIKSVVNSVVKSTSGMFKTKL
jgi:hypothetical protein